MPHLYITYDSTATPPGMHLYVRNEGSDTPIEIYPLPPEIGMAPANRKPVTLRYRNRSYIIGISNRPIIRDEFGTTRAMGVRAPKSKPTLVDGGGTGGSKGLVFGYQTFVVKNGDRKIAESNPGPATDTLDAAGTGFLWDNIDWKPDDSHVTHVRGYRSVDGEVAALAWERPLSPIGTQVFENVLTAALGECLPVRTGPDGTIVTDVNARSVPPYSKWCEKYHNAFFYSGDPQHPERVYPSKLYEPEAVDVTPITIYGRTEEPWLNTTDGMPVTGIKRQGEDLVVGTLKGIDVINGYSHGDYTIRRISDYWGVLSHFSMCRCGPLNSLYFAAPQGPTLYNAGAFKFAGEPIETWWRDNYKATPQPFLDSYGAEDRWWKTYKLLLPNFGAGYSFYLILDYNTAEIGQPNWVTDMRARLDHSQGELLTGLDSDYYELYSGSCDGIVRKENDDDDPDDDGDDYKKKMTLTTSHRYVAGQEGDDTHGRNFVGLDLFMKHADNDVAISMYGGDDDSPSAVAPQWSETSPATAAKSGERPLVEKTSEHHVPTDLSGKGVTLKVEVTAPVGVEYRGWSVEHIPGEQARPFKQ